MAASLSHIDSDTPMGANLIADGATFRVWAPHAHAVHVLGDFNDRRRDDASLLTRDDHGHWRGFIAGARDRDRYIFYVVGEGSEGPKRDPYARELQTPFPSDCIIRETDFPWHASGYVTASLAPHRPMRHVIVVGVIGTIAGTAGLVATWNLGFGPRWYPLALAISGFPCVWLGGALFARRRA